MAKIVFIGGGSTVFTRNLVGDVLSLPELADTTTFALMDVDAERLRARSSSRGAWQTHIMRAPKSRRRAIAAPRSTAPTTWRPAFRSGGFVPRRRPTSRSRAPRPAPDDRRHAGVGGIMRALRTIPVLLDVCADMRELCPGALLLQYVNPMAMLCWAVAEAGAVRSVGLCHSVQHTKGELARDLGLEPGEIDHHVAAINHLAFFLRLEREGEDLYPLLQRILEERRVPPDNRVRHEVLRHFGSFVTESSEHFAEYVPWFVENDRPDLVERFNIPLDEYLHRGERQIAEWGALRASLEAGATLGLARSHEYGADIIRACETRGAVRLQRQRAQYVRGRPAHRRPAGDRCVEVPCGRPRAASSRSPWASSRAIWPPSCRPTSTSRAWPSRQRSVAAGIRPTTPRCSTRPRPPSSRSTRSGGSWTTSTRPTARGSPGA
jgi:alpha-galactosidase